MAGDRVTARVFLALPPPLILSAVVPARNQLGVGSGWSLVNHLLAEMLAGARETGIWLILGKVSFQTVLNYKPMGRGYSQVHSGLSQNCPSPPLWVGEQWNFRVLSPFC